MGLSLALNTARSSLIATSTQIAVSARNTAGASDPFYTRKIANLVAAGGGSAVSIQRATDVALFDRKLAGTASAAASEAVLDGLDTLQGTIGDTGDGTSAAARLGALNAALKAAANKPDDAALARDAVDRARDLATSLNTGAAAVQTVRAQADAGLADSVATINDLLAQFEAANRVVTSGTAAGTDVTDALDDRDRILAGLSREIGISTVIRAGNDVAIYTDSGVPLFERSARRVAFSPTAPYSAGTTGGAVMVDGVAVTGANSPMPVHSGRIAGLAELRDGVATRYESQLDGIANGLIDAFAETGTDAGGQAVRAAGLFTAGAGAPVPNGTTGDQTGLAARIRVSASVDPQQGGDVTLLRDGGIAGAIFRSNPAASGDTAFPDRLRALASVLTADRAFDPASDLATQSNLQDFATASIGWLAGKRQAATAESAYQATLLARASDAYSNATGVNADDETAAALDLERSYTASAKLLTLVNDLLKTLMDAVR
ncbi:flagellar biosynthesis protein FlgK [Methylobacterium sp. Leaf104]|uniref:flagellar hook-associated protein FlgK n=1 Tax=Methylobacterium TaxID=407 RepID=UPI0006F5301F|nr:MULTISPECIES: flagellar hook-associated protein FlgK [Methylobacterium]KQP29910.1 flagellar biosynthesis protein FlgK [Methylobacterium sp. Leaf104]MCI9882396.1 flagellar hook-associated protein FlgK [Methylobacterium goesingense]